MHLFINGLAAAVGGGLTYLRNVVPQLSNRTELQTTIAVNPQLAREFAGLPSISVLTVEIPSGMVRRFWHEQTILPPMIRECRGDILLSTGNIALRKSSVPQILLSRNALYTSDDFRRDLRHRGDHRLWAETCVKAQLAKRSIQWADCTIAPTQAFAEELHMWTGRNVIISIHHGFDGERFFRNGDLPEDLRHKLDSHRDALRLLFVSHYNYYRNFETLLQALPLLNERLGGRRAVLFLTCRLQPGLRDDSYRTDHARRLIQRLGVCNQIVELGTVPYHLLHHVYRSCDVYVTPAYAESFAHPLVEAMASGVPVVASDIQVHREICGAAAIYFHRFSHRELASRLVDLADSDEDRRQLAGSGRKRSLDFSWEGHVHDILELASQMVRPDRPMVHAELFVR
jgi:glycosyltransferase involved in cell wall biosynthesis